MVVGMGYGDQSFPYTGCPVPDLNIYYASDMTNVWNTVS